MQKETKQQKIPNHRHVFSPRYVVLNELERAMNTVMNLITLKINHPTNVSQQSKTLLVT